MAIILHLGQFFPNVHKQLKHELLTKNIRLLNGETFRKIESVRLSSSLAFGAGELSTYLSRFTKKYFRS